MYVLTSNYAPNITNNNFLFYAHTLETSKKELMENKNGRNSEHRLKWITDTLIYAQTDTLLLT